MWPSAGQYSLLRVFPVLTLTAERDLQKYNGFTLLLEEVSIPSFHTESVCGSVSKRTCACLLNYFPLFLHYDINYCFYQLNFCYSRTITKRAGIQKERIRVGLHYSIILVCDEGLAALARVAEEVQRFKHMREGVRVTLHQKKALKQLFYLEARDGEEKTVR